jgi:hypothetical protein
MDEGPPASVRRLRPAIVVRAARHPLRYAARAVALVRPKRPAWKARRAPIELSRQECEEFFQKTLQLADYYDRLFQDHARLTLYYEELLTDRDATLARAQAFLEATPRRLEASTARQNPESLRELIANYDALGAALAGTPYEAFFDES